MLRLKFKSFRVFPNLSDGSLNSPRFFESENPPAATEKSTAEAKALEFYEQIGLHIRRSLKLGRESADRACHLFAVGDGRKWKREVVENDSHLNHDFKKLIFIDTIRAWLQFSIHLTLQPFSIFGLNFREKNWPCEPTASNINYNPALPSFSEKIHFTTGAPIFRDQEKAFSESENWKRVALRKLALISSKRSCKSARFTFFWNPDLEFPAESVHTWSWHESFGKHENSELILNLILNLLKLKFGFMDFWPLDYVWFWHPSFPRSIKIFWLLGWSFTRNVSLFFGSDSPCEIPGGLRIARRESDALEILRCYDLGVLGRSTGTSEN